MAATATPNGAPAPRVSFFSPPPASALRSTAQVATVESARPPAPAPDPAPASTKLPGKTTLLAPAGPPPQAKPSAPKVRNAAPRKKPAEPAPPDGLGRLTRLGFKTLPECLLSIPKDYFDYRQPHHSVTGKILGTSCYLVLRVRGRKLYTRGKTETQQFSEAKRIELECTDSKGQQVFVVAFNNIWPWLKIERGEIIHVYGDVEHSFGSLRVGRPHIVPEHCRGRLMPVYAGKAGQVSGEVLGVAVGKALDYLDEAEVHLLAQAGLRESEFTAITSVQSPSMLLRALHAPKTIEGARRATSIARKLSAETVVRRALAARERPMVSRSAIAINRTLVNELISDLPFAMTKDQRQAVDEIVADLRAPYPMNRLLSGDVGTGKSATFMVPAAAAFAAGAEVGILVPNELLVPQIASELRAYYPDLPVCEVAASGKLEHGIAVGTTALFSAARKAKKVFDLLIVDEQHKFSIDQRRVLCAAHTNVVEATATAIPRTQALIEFGGMDVSVLAECPVEKQIVTRVVQKDDSERVNAFIGELVRRGGQVAVIYPLVEADKPGKATKEGAQLLESVIEGAKAWELRHPGRVGVLHGRLSTEEKNAVIDGMKAGRFDILVSSLVIEVGVTLPSLRAIVIESPDRFGMAQLHQLRGRVARKGGKGFMFLMAPPELDEETQERLTLLTVHNDGFALAVADMNQRGFGDVSDDSTLQSGTSRTLFHNAALTHDEIAATARRLGVVV